MPDTHAAAAARPTGPPGPVGGPGAWTGPDMARRTGEWLHILTDAELAEIETAIRAHKAAGRAMGEITAETFRLPTFGPRLAAVLEDLLHGPGFAVLRGLPVERLGTEDSAIGYLGI